MTKRLPLLASALALAAAGTAVDAQTSKARRPAPAATSAATPTTDAATPAPAATDGAQTGTATTAPAMGMPQSGAAATGQNTGTGTTAPNPTVGGAVMDASKTIVDNASAAPNLTTLVSAVKEAGLAATLAGPGPFTVFAPTNDAFSRLAPGTLTTLMKPDQKASLAKVLQYHVISGKLSLADLKAKIAAGGGTTTLDTVAGQPLTVTFANNIMTLTDPNGNKSYVETADVMQSNGVVHVVNGVLVPKLN